jgi:ribose-phosphate pyrophosphokinase
VTQIADHLRIDFALIHRERHHIRLGNEETGKTETRITLVGDVKNKIALMLVCLQSS